MITYNYGDRETLRQEIAEQTREFLANGGVIQDCTKPPIQPDREPRLAFQELHDLEG